MGMFLDLVSEGHISMSHAKICPGTPPLVNISFRRRSTHSGITYPQDVTYAGEAWHDALVLTAVA